VVFWQYADALDNGSFVSASSTFPNTVNVFSCALSAEHKVTDNNRIIKFFILNIYFSKDG
jgi:hypothetical protein